MMILIVICWVVLAVCTYLLARNNLVHAERNRVIDIVFVKKGTEFDQAYSMYKKYSYSDMLYSIRSVKLFYKDIK